MRGFLLISVLLWAGLCGFRSEAADYPLSDNGTMMPLSFPAETPVLPDSLTPFFVSHIGRHGARFMSSSKNIAHLRRTLDETSSLTPAGEAFSSLIESVARHTAGRWGALDSLGEAEQTRIASTLDAMLPGFFAHGNVTAMSSYVARCVASMYAFCHELGRRNPGLQMTASSGPDYNPLLRFFDTDTGYASYLKDGDWKRVYEEYYAATVPVAPAIRLSAGFEPLAPEELQRITMEMYAVLQSLSAAGLPADISRFMSPVEYHACWLVSNLEHALCRTDTPWSDLPGKGASALLRDILSTADLAVASCREGPVVKAVFRFGHAETVMPLFSLMEIPGCTVPSDATPATVGSFWNDSFVSPLGANLQMIFCTSSSGKVYVMTLLNGRPTPAMPGAESAVTEWPRLRAFWQELLSHF